MSVQSLRSVPAPERSHDREPHPASGCSRGDRGAGWRWLKRRHRDIFSTADTFASALSPSAQQRRDPLICRCLAVPEHQDGSARACSSPPCPSKLQPPNSQKGAETDISTLLSADILALLLRPIRGNERLRNVWSKMGPDQSPRDLIAQRSLSLFAAKSRGALGDEGSYSFPRIIGAAGRDDG